MIDLDKLREYRRQNDMLEARNRARARAAEVSLEELRVRLARWQLDMKVVQRLQPPQPAPSREYRHAEAD